MKFVFYNLFCHGQLEIQQSIIVYTIAHVKTIYLGFIIDTFSKSQRSNLQTQCRIKWLANLSSYVVALPLYQSLVATYVSLFDTNHSTKQLLFFHVIIF